MILTTKARYAVMAIIDMVEHSFNKPVSLALISERQNISLSYLEQIFAKLRRFGIVNAIKGPNGGYILAKNPKQITIADIVYGIGEPIKMTRCGNKFLGCMKNKKRCLTHDLWHGLEDNIHKYLSSFLISDFLTNDNFKKSELVATGLKKQD